MSETELRRRLAGAPPDFDPLAPGPIRARADRRRRLGTAGAVAGAAVLATAAVLVPRLGTAPAPTAAAPTPAPAATSPAPAARSCPPPRSDGIVDYIPFVRLDGVLYEQTSGRHGGARPVRGDRVGVVRCTLERIQPGSAYRIADGDAAFLPAGTALYATRGAPAAFRVVTADGQVFEAGSGPRVRTGADLLPLRGLVTSIDVRGPAVDLPPGREPPLRRRITGPAQVRAVLTGIAAAPVVDRAATVETAQVWFRLTDGTVVARAWSAPDRLLEGRLALPPAVAAVLAG